MAPAWFTVIGVILGAIVGGVAQIAANLLTRGESRRHHRLNVRRETYEAVVVAGHALLMRALIIRRKADPDPLSRPNPLVELETLGATVARLQMVAPPDTYEAAKQMQDELALSLQSDGPSPTLNIQPFIDLAKRDLALDQPELTRRQRLAKGLRGRP